MIKETIKLKLTDEYKQEAMQIIEDTIEKTRLKHHCELSEQNVTLIRNLSLDQVNINVTQKNKSKTIWTFDAEKALPVVITKDKKMKAIADEVAKDPSAKLFSMKSNGSWICSRNIEDGEDRINYDELETTLLAMLLEDFETAAFYGTLSLMNNSDKEI